MGIFTPGRRAQPRRFSYEPRYYKPEKDESIKRRMRVKSASRSNRRKPNVIRIAILLVFALYIYYVLI